MPLPFATKDYRVSSPFGSHNGLDFAIASGTPVTSTVNGVVETTKVITRKNDRANGSYGVYVVVRDAQGNRHYYAHLSNFYVKAGQRVSAGTVLGASGNSGNSSGPHLHYEIRGGDGSQVDPTGLISDGVIPGFQSAAEDVVQGNFFTQTIDSLSRLPNLDPAGVLDGVNDILGIKDANDTTRASWIFGQLSQEHTARQAEVFADNDISKINERMTEAVLPRMKIDGEDII